LGAGLARLRTGARQRFYLRAQRFARRSPNSIYLPGFNQYSLCLRVAAPKKCLGGKG
jgi:hypothetical protein